MESIAARAETATWPADPYKGLTFYGVGDVPLFAGRDSDIDAVCSIIGLGNIRILLLHGMTGCGKSSFLRAGLIPALEDEIAGYEFLRDETRTPVFVRSTDDPTASLARRIHQFTKREYSVDPEKKQEKTPVRRSSIGIEKATDDLLTSVRNSANRPTVPATSSRNDAISFSVDIPREEEEFVRLVAEDPQILVKTIEEIASRRPRTFVLVIDQAEEVVTLKPDNSGDEPRVQFFDFLSDLSRSRHDLKLIIAFRTEYHGQFYAQLRYGADVSRINDYYLADFNKNQIVEAILRPTAKEEIPGYGIPYEYYGFEYEPGLPEDIADALLSAGLSGGVLPALQIVCRRLYEGEKTQAELRQKLKSKRTASAEQVVKFKISKTAYTSLRGVVGQVDAYLHSELESALKQRFGMSVGFWGTSREIRGWKKVLAKLAKRQVNGTTTSDVIEEEKLEEEAVNQGCQIDPSEMFRFLADDKRRILRPADVTSLVTRKVVHCYSLGHDVLASALQAWKDRTRLERFAIWKLRGTCGVVAVGLLATWAFAGQKSKGFLAWGIIFLLIAVLAPFWISVFADTSTGAPNQNSKS